MSNRLIQALGRSDQDFALRLRQFLGSSGSGAAPVIPTATNYSALPDPVVNSGKIYIALSSQGTRWLPGPLGGTYYAKGFYISDGALWSYLGEVPNQATQSQVNAETDPYSFITALTLGQWFLQKTLPLSQIGTGAVSLSEFNYLSGVSSSIQGQLNTLAAADIGSPAINNYSSSQILSFNTINYFNTTGGACVATLPTAVGNAGKSVTVVWDSGAATLSMATVSSQTIQGVNASQIKYVLLGQIYTYTSDGSNYKFS